MGDDSKLILAIVQRTETSLDNHIEVEERRLAKINEKLDEHTREIGILGKSVAVQQQKNNYITSFIAMIVAGFVSWFASIRG